MATDGRVPLTLPLRLPLQVLALLGALLTFVPTCDECFAQPPASSHGGAGRARASLALVGGSGSRATVRPAETVMGAAAAGRAAAGGYLHSGGAVVDLHEHVLGLGSYVEGGISLAVGFWSQRMEIEMTRPAVRAPDGTAELRPLPLHALHRRNYAGRVCAAMCFLVLDVLCNLYTDTLHWTEVRPTDQRVPTAALCPTAALAPPRSDHSAPHPPALARLPSPAQGRDDLYTSVSLTVVPGLLRILFFVPFVLLITQVRSQCRRSMLGRACRLLESCCPAGLRLSSECLDPLPCWPPPLV